MTTELVRISLTEEQFTTLVGGGVIEIPIDKPMPRSPSGVTYLSNTPVIKIALQDIGIARMAMIVEKEWHRLLSNIEGKS